MSQRWVAAAGLVVALALGASSTRFWAPVVAADVPSELSNAEFWRMVSDFSEPDGFFDSDNLISNEDSYQTVIPELARTVKPGSVYLGVGPDQNFTYIAAIQPRLAFITDVRRGNLHVHLMYKAIVELSADRAEFLSRLFSRPRPTGVGPASSPEELFRAYVSATPDRALYDANFRAILDRLTTEHGFALDADDRAGLSYVYSSFFSGGPGLMFVSSRPGTRYPTYQELMLASDGQGQNRGYLGTETLFQRLKAIEQRNAIVPLVGNFAGPKAIRAVGAYVKAHGGTVGAFYTSNVEQYLFQDGLWDEFIGNVRTLPIDDSTLFIRACFNNCAPRVGTRSVSLLDSMAGLLKDVGAAAIRSYGDVIAHSRR